MVASASAVSGFAVHSCTKDRVAAMFVARSSEYMPAAVAASLRWA